MAETNEDVSRAARRIAIGFACALALTVIPFAIVFAGALPARASLALIAALALVQIIVHLRFFLHLDLRPSSRDNLIALLFASVLVVIMIGGSLWIMFDLHLRMRST